MHINSPILLVGSGRLAKHLQHWNSLFEIPNTIFTWNRSQSFELLKGHLEKCRFVWLAISDSAIIPFYEKYLNHYQYNIVHFSGALNDPRFLSAHPLMSFPQNLLPDEVYSKIHFVINGAENLNQALPNFKNQFTVLNDENKSLYHALCVLAGNFPQLLWHEITQEMKALQLPAEALDLYIKQITENYLAYKGRAITGPLVRRDLTTIEKNLASLEFKPKLKNIYSTFTKEFAK